MHARLLTLLLVATPLVACTGADPEPPPAPAARGDFPEPRTALGRTVDKAIQEARRELATENLTISGGKVMGVHIGGVQVDSPSADLPKAEITPAGDLLIDGSAVAIDADHRALLLQYRSHIHAIAEAGMALGVRGADLGMQAAGEAIKGIFSGNPDDAGKRIEAEAAAMEVEAEKLCAHMPALLATQRELAESLPAFAPYATMKQADVDDCGEKKRGDRRDAIRETIRSEVRGAVQDAVPGDDAPPATGTRSADARTSAPER